MARSASLSALVQRPESATPTQPFCSRRPPPPPSSVRRRRLARILHASCSRPRVVGPLQIRRTASNTRPHWPRAGPRHAALSAAHSAQPAELVPAVPRPCPPARQSSAQRPQEAGRTGQARSDCLLHPSCGARRDRMAAQVGQGCLPAQAKEDHRLSASPLRSTPTQHLSLSWWVGLPDHPGPKHHDAPAMLCHASLHYPYPRTLSRQRTICPDQAGRAGTRQCKLAWICYDPPGCQLGRRAALQKEHIRTMLRVASPLEYVTVPTPS